GASGRASRTRRRGGQFLAPARRRHRGEPSRGAPRVATCSLCRVGRGHAGLSRLLFGGYDRICSRLNPGACDQKRATRLGARYRRIRDSTPAGSAGSGGKAMYRKILVAYNGTPESRSALDEAMRFAPDASVEVHLAGVVHYPSAYLLAGEYVPEVALADEREHMEADLKNAHALLAGNGLTVIDHLVVGEPVDVLTKLVAELG